MEESREPSVKKIRVQVASMPASSTSSRAPVAAFQDSAMISPEVTERKFLIRGDTNDMISCSKYFLRAFQRLTVVMGRGHYLNTQNSSQWTSCILQVILRQFSFQEIRDNLFSFQINDWIWNSQKLDYHFEGFSITQFSGGYIRKISHRKKMFSYQLWNIPQKFLPFKEIEKCSKTFHDS